MRNLLSLLLLIAAAAPPAMAQNSVYAPLPPAGSAYVRFVNALCCDVMLRPDFLPSRQLVTTPSERVTSYFVVNNVAGRGLSLDAQAGPRSGHFTFHAEPGSFVTIILEAVAAEALGAVPVIDDTEFNQTRARLSFYNATPGCPAGRLALDPGGPAVFQDVAPGTAKVRSVNPVRAHIRATCTDQVTAPFDLEGLEAGGMYSVWLMEPGATPAAFLTRDVTDRWRP